MDEPVIGLANCIAEVGTSPWSSANSLHRILIEVADWLPCAYPKKITPTTHFGDYSTLPAIGDSVTY